MNGTDVLNRTVTVSRVTNVVDSLQPAGMKEAYKKCGLQCLKIMELLSESLVRTLDMSFASVK